LNAADNGYLEGGNRKAESGKFKIKNFRLSPFSIPKSEFYHIFVPIKAIDKNETSSYLYHFIDINLFVGEGTNLYRFT
jgi:hypothetical protein